MDTDYSTYSMSFNTGLRSTIRCSFCVVLSLYVIMTLPRASMGFSSVPQKQRLPVLHSSLFRASKFNSPRKSIQSLHARKKKSSASAASSVTAPVPAPLNSLLKLVLPGPTKKKKTSVQSGIQAALFLTDKKRQEEWKKDMRQSFPVLPNVVLDVCIDALTEVFKTITPKELQAALQPGGLEKARPNLEASIVSNLESQQVLKNVPLKADDKRQLLQYLVSLALDYFLKDVELMLAEPSVKLQALESQKREILKYMSFWEIQWYRVRYFPLQMATVVAASVCLTYFFYQETKHSFLVSSVTGFLWSVYSRFQTVLLKLSKLLEILGKFLRERGARRLMIRQ
mmetsp:Transcript_17123/g.25940  ORF Transcript_17123/g.25940 Transcript_17123/m.25940 type:complete len:341 (-) Transcript_17123:354-1376(-)